MSEPTTHPAVDVVVLGAGMIGGVIAADLTTAGYSVVGIEKGPKWDYAVDWAPSNIHDEWAIAVERKFDHPLQISSFTIRNDREQFALPVRRYTKLIQYHALGHGVGGAATHWGGSVGRYGPWSFKPYSMTIDKYGDSMLPTNHDMEDFPITYDEAKPYFEAWENAMGVTGTNEDPFIPGVKYPAPPSQPTPIATKFRDAAESMGYHPYPAVTALTSNAHTNQYNITRNACIYCGWCGGLCNYICEVGAKSSSHVTTVPAALATGKYDLRIHSYAYRIDLDAAKKKATGVRYYDAAGNVHIQPAKAVFNGIWGYNIIRIMLLSGIGRPYDPVAGTGSLGRGLTNGYSPSVTSVRGTMNIGGNAYSSGNAAGGGFKILDFADDNFDHKGQNFIGGSAITVGGYLGSAPGLITAFNPGKDNFGSQWKAGLKDVKLPNRLTVSAAPSGPEIPTKDQFVDLDPHYTDIYGDPLARITIDWGANRWRPAEYIAPKVGEIFTKMGATNVAVNKVPELNQHVDWWGHHMRGGSRMGEKSETSVFNKWMQSWDVENLFAASETSFPFGDNITAGTHPAGMLAYLAADGIKKYLNSPGPLVA